MLCWIPFVAHIESSQNVATSDKQQYRQSLKTVCYLEAVAFLDLFLLSSRAQGA